MRGRGALQLGRVASLDGLRAIAVAAVLVYHANPDWLPGGFLGVDLFFVLSGFLITTLLLTQLEAGHDGVRARLKNFYVRRARRLLPALVIVIAVTLVAMCAWWRADLRHDRGDVPAVLGFAGNWWYVFRHQDYFASVGRPSPFQHLWSLGVEEQFYLVWPVLLWVLWRLGRGRRLGVVATVALAGALASAAWMAFLAVTGDVPFRTGASRVYFGTDTHAMGLLLGATGAALRLQVLDKLRGFRGVVARRVIRRRMPRWARADGLALAACAAVVALTMQTNEFSTSLYRWGFLLFSAVSLVAVLAAAQATGISTKVLANAPMRWLGERSYGVYLWHWPVFVFTRPDLDLPVGAVGALAIRIPATLLLAEASYRWVELPIRRDGFVAVLGRWFGGIPERAMAVGALAVPCLAAAVIALPQSVSTTVATAAAAQGPAPTVVRTTSHRPAKVGAPTITFIGDSVMLGAEGQLRHDLGKEARDAQFHVREGFQPSDALDLLAALTSRHAVGSDLVLHIGTNGPIDPSRLGHLLDRLRGHRIVLVTDHMPQPWHSFNNHTIRAVARGHRGTRVVDWDALARKHRGWFWSDGIHVRSSGADAYARLVASALA